MPLQGYFPLDKFTVRKIFSLGEITEIVVHLNNYFPFSYTQKNFTITRFDHAYITTI